MIEELSNITIGGEEDEAGEADLQEEAEVVVQQQQQEEISSQEVELEGVQEDDMAQGALFDLDELEWWKKHWQGMPYYEQEDLTPWQSVLVHFTCKADKEAFTKLVGQRFSGPGRQTRSIWYPEAEIGVTQNKRWFDRTPSGPQYPIYVPSKGRWESRYTIKALEKIGVKYRVVVEAQEADEYAAVINHDLGTMLVLPHRDEGLVVTRNWIWDHAEAEGWEKFWTIDDNVTTFFRTYRNTQIPIGSGGFFKIMEDFVGRYDNVPVAGMNYFMFAPRKAKYPPFYKNTRVYSNMLIDLRARDGGGRPWRNEGYFNDDTDLCLRILKDGGATILFNAFVMLKVTTMKTKGGLTEEYVSDGRRRFVEELVEKHPDVARATEKWGRLHHHVDYSPFKHNDLGLKEGAEAHPPGPDERGLVLQDLVDGRWVDRDEEDMGHV